MGVTAEGQDVRDVRRQLYAPDNPSWITIQPSGRLSMDHDGPNGETFRIRCNHVGEGGSFEKEMPFDEALRTLRALLREQYARYQAWKRGQERMERSNRLRQIKEARKNLRAAQARLKDAQGK